MMNGRATFTHGQTYSLLDESAKSEPSLIGQTISHYRIVEELGAVAWGFTRRKTLGFIPLSP